MMSTRINIKKDRFPRTKINKSYILVLGILILCFSFPTPLTISDSDYSDSRTNDFQPYDNRVISSASDNGNDIDSTMIYSREIQGLNFGIMNSFSDTSSHLGSIDFTGYHIAGWSLYEVLITPSRIVALPEDEIVGNTSSPSNLGFRIYEHDLNLYYDSLTQGFYDMVHDGKLLNISILYDSPTYDPSNQNYAYLDIRTDYQDGSTNMVPSVQLGNVGLTATWASMTEPIILNTGTTYYAVLNGSTLIEYSDVYPIIRWFYEDATGAFLTRRHNTDGDTWGSDRPFEAMMKYTYIPWNITSDLALEYQNPQTIGLQGNSSSLSGSEWLFSSTSNVSTIEFSANQSISIEYDLTLRYKQDVTSTVTWYASASGSDIAWNITSVLDYPALSGTQDNNLTLMLPTDWTAIHLINTTSPTQYYDHFTQIGSDVKCSLLADETWILECTSPNYLKSISKFDASDDSLITDKVSVSIIMDINSTIESALSVPVTNGVANLRVLYQGSVEYSENSSTTAGKSYHQWDIATDSSSNGLHTIDISWTNGTEVGYHTSDVVVFYETALVADDYFINAFTEDSFYVGIDFTRIFPVGGIDAAAADVTYSFGTVVNQSLTDRSNGRWDATVSTTGMAFAIHTLTVYAEGYALENRSMTIDVTLIHDTLPLTILWSNTNNISYVESTELSVAYTQVGGTPISGATINVTIGTSKWQLNWDGGTETYKILFNGTDVDPGFGTHSLTIDAGKVGFKPQSDSTETLDIHEESTIFNIEWTGSTSITFVESITLYVDYQMSNTTAIPDATVEVTINLDVFVMNWNNTSKRYWYQFNGNDILPGFGVHSLTIEANKFGYQYQSDLLQTLTITEEPTTLVLSWVNGNSITYVTSTTLIANYTQSNGAAVTGATVNVSIGAGFWSMNWNPATFVYELTIDGNDAIPGFGTHSVTVLAGNAGFVDKSDSTQNLIVSLESTSITISWSNTNNITFVEQTTLIVSFKMSNTTPIVGAIVNVTISGTRWDLTWDSPSETYRVLFLGSDIPPGLGIHSLTIRAGKYGYVNQEDVTETLTLREEPTSLVISWSNTNSITYVESTTLIASYRMSNFTPITAATITVTIGVDSWPLVWHPGTQTYRYTFTGADSPPGFGIHSITIDATKTGYETQVNGTEVLTLSIEPTTFVISWSNTNSITYVKSTILIVNFTMSDGSPVTAATVNVTIDGTRWDLEWDVGSETYQVIFLGSDTPPGFGTHSLTIRAGKYGFVNHVNSTETLTLSEEPTSMLNAWLDSSTITYLESTTLVVNYRMSNTTSISGATVTATINSILYPLTWHPTSQTYRYTFSGSDNPPGIGIHGLMINATKTGFESQSDLGESLVIDEEPTTMVITWSNTNSITFVESTILIVNYTINDGTPISGAVVNVTIGVTRWDLIWDIGTETYQVEFFGTDIPPGFGVHSLIIRAGKFGHVNQVNSTESLTLSEEPTSLVISWSNTNTITYLESTTLIVSYRMSELTPITMATVTVTIGSDSWPLVWNAGTQTYRYTFIGAVATPGFGIHNLTIDASKTGFVTQQDSSEVLTINEVPTFFVIAWSNTNSITFVESTILSVNYTKSDGSPVTGALVNATIGGRLWILIWDVGSKTYRVELFGSDEPPGFGTFSITIKADKFGYVGHTDVSQSLTLESEPTSLVVSWIPDNDITYTTYSILSVHYRMSDTTPISGAIVNVTFGGTLWPLVWSPGDQDYRLQINGSDALPGFGIYSLNIQASKKGFDPQTDLTETVTLRAEPTSLVISWSNGNDLEYFEHTYLFVNYRMENLSTILGATLNVTINGHMWLMVWNSTEGKYQLRFNGSDSIPGVGSHSLIIRAGKSGYINQVDSSQILTLPVIPTTLSLIWTEGNSITYVEQTILRAIYEMWNGTRITDATLNVTIDGAYWILVWNGGTQAYEHTFLGSDSPPGFGMHSITVLAWREDFQSQSDLSESLTLSIEQTSLVVFWTNGNNISYHSDTTLSVSYRMSDATPITAATLNATIGGTLWILTWNPGSEAYEVMIYGSDVPPGFGTHSVVIEASKFGFEPQSDSTEELTLRVEDTSLVFQWDTSDTITYVEETTFKIFYLMSNGSSISGATVNVTIDPWIWTAIWNEMSGAYEVTFYGLDDRLSFSGHICLVKASKPNYMPLVNSSQTLTKIEEPTGLLISWSNGNDITYSESTMLYVSYTMSNGTSITDAWVKVDTGVYSWSLEWDTDIQLYKVNFTETGAWPGLGVHSLEITCNRSGYVTKLDISKTLTIHGEFGDIDSYWIGDGIITFIESDTLVVNYTIADGTPISGATVNVTIDGHLWELVWHPASETYRLVFNGTDNPPNLGSHTLEIRAWRLGFDGVLDTSLTLNIIDEPTTIGVVWSNSNSITYFEDTYLFVRYFMSNGSDILGAELNVTIDGTTWNLLWNSTQGAYGALFNGWDDPPGLESHSIIIKASKFGFAYLENNVEVLTLAKDPTSISISWSNGNDITYVESTTLIVEYRMSNNTPISTGTVTATIGTVVWSLVWNATSESYYVVFIGDMSPPGLGTFSVQIDASGTIFASQSASEPLNIREEPTTAIGSWITATIDWTESIILGIDYRDTYGRLIDGATQRTITVDGSTYTLQGTNGTYWIEFDNSFDLGHHIVTVNISKFGYEFAVNASISFDIVSANTDLALVWNFTIIDYLGQIILTADYTYSGTGDSIPVGFVEANITIGGITTLSLTPSGSLWTITIDGDYLDLGSHSVVIRAQAYGYNFAESSEILTVNEVSTISSDFTWTPSNLTIEYTDSLELVVDYTYVGGDVPATAIVNVTIEGRFYDMFYSAGAWRVSIPGSDLGTGIFDAYISAWLYGYELRTFVTYGINITVAANSFVVSWEPWDLTPTYIDTVNLSVVYTEDFLPILDATIRLYINGSVYDLTYNPIDEMWHFSINAATIDLGTWNVTITANKTGYADGYYTDILTVVVVPTVLSIQDTGTTFYYDETTTVDIYYQLTNLSFVPSSMISFTLNSVEQIMVWNVDHWSTILNGTELEIGVFTFTIETSAYGYETQIDTLEITVISIPTSMIRDPDIDMFARDSVSFRVTYIDDRTSTPIPASELDVIWGEFYNLVTLPNYTYVITIGGDNFHVGNYTFQLTLGRLGFDNRTGSIDINVYPIPTEFVYETTYSQYENETIVVELQVFDTVHSILIDWAYVVVELEGVGYVAINTGINSTYEVILRLPLNIAPGTYSLFIHSEAADCISADTVSTLTVLAKHTYILTTNGPEEAEAGGNIPINILVMEDGQPVQGVYVTITCIVHLSNGSQYIITEGAYSDNRGIVEIIFSIPDDAIRIDVSASFQGSISEWPAESYTIHIDVIPAGTSTGTTSGIPINVDPLVLAIVTGGIAVPILALAFRRRRRGIGGVSASITVTPSPPTLPPTPHVVGIQKRLIDEITNSEEGITRAELSRHLGPSSSKIGVMVKDLLDSDSGFYEVRDGSRKLIKFRKPE